jgi:hypothetical protein
MSPSNSDKMDEESSTTIMESSTTIPPTSAVQVLEEGLSPTISRMESVLLQTLTDCHVQSEVEACMHSMLLDVETTYSLRQELQLQKHQHTIHHLTRQQQATVLESQAERLARDEQRVQLADGMVEELMALSRELETLVQWKKEHSYKVEHYDEVVAKLTQTEEELQAANRVSYGGGPKARRPVNEAEEGEPSEPQEKSSPTKSVEKQASREDVAKPAASESATDEAEPQASSTEDTPETEPAAEEEEGDDKKPAAETIVEIPPSAPTETIVVIPPESAGTVVDIPDATDAPKTEDTRKDDAAEPAAAVVVSLDYAEPEEEVPGLVEIDMEILMSIFGFMDAIDILNTAQINLSMYSRVDNIFGISEDGQSPPKPTPPARKKKKPPAQQPAATIAQPKAKPTPAPAAAPPAAANKPTAAPAESGPLGKGLFSMLQPRAAAGAAVLSGKRQESGRGPLLNASVAQSMASKLSDAELAAIISMTEKLSKMEKEVNLLRNEKEALTHKLDGTEAVKQFLISKVRDVDLKLTQSRDDEIKVTQQIASDQEVIAFLDSRVQELERQNETITKEKSGFQSELQSLKESSSKKITMLSDMLKYEREKLKDEESDWKATKKVLVKEVKSCRAQILALQAERDGLKEQNEMLKRAIVSTGKSTAGSPGR